MERGTFYGCDCCRGGWLFNCRFCEHTFLCANLKFSSRCLLTATESDQTPILSMGRFDQVFGQTVSTHRWNACMDALEKIFHRHPPFTLDEETGVLEPDLSDRVVRELRSFKEFRQDQFEEIFRPRVVGGNTPLSRVALLMEYG